MHNWEMSKWALVEKVCSAVISVGHTAIQGFDCGPIAARQFNRMSVHPNFVRLFLTKSWVDQFLDE